jgi:transposase
VGQHVRDTPAAQRAARIIGIGELGASALVAGVGEFRQFNSGEQFGAWLGIVPRQDSSGGKTRLGRIYPSAATTTCARCSSRVPRPR